MGVIGGPLGQLTQSLDIDRELELLRNAPTYSVGESTEEFPSKVSDLISGPTEIDETFIEVLTTAALETDVNQSELEDLRDFLSKHKGNEVFTKGW